MNSLVWHRGQYCLALYANIYAFLLLQIFHRIEKGKKNTNGFSKLNKKVNKLGFMFTFHELQKSPIFEVMFIFYLSKEDRKKKTKIVKNETENNAH